MTFNKKKYSRLSCGVTVEYLGEETLQILKSMSMETIPTQRKLYFFKYFLHSLRK